MIIIVKRVASKIRLMLFKVAWRNVNKHNNTHAESYFTPKSKSWKTYIWTYRYLV